MSPTPSAVLGLFRTHSSSLHEVYHSCHLHDQGWHCLLNCHPGSARANSQLLEPLSQCKWCWYLENKREEVPVRKSGNPNCLQALVSRAMFEVWLKEQLWVGERPLTSCAFPLFCCVIQGWGYQSSRNEDLDQWVQHSIWDFVNGFGNRQSWTCRRNSEAVQTDTSFGSRREVGAFVSVCKLFFSIYFIKRKILFNWVYLILLTVVFL